MPDETFTPEQQAAFLAKEVTITLSVAEISASAAALLTLADADGIPHENRGVAEHACLRLIRARNAARKEFLDENSSTD